MSIDSLRAALADRYTIERELGAGGMATVYLAHDLKHDRQVAIKVLRPELAAVIGADRFLSEIKTTANLQHPHILGLIDSGDAGGLLWYAMPFIEGESLRDRLTREKQLAVAEAVRIATEVAAALDYAHRHGVIHRDIKPENILLHDGNALVADFGIALAASSAGTRMTETGMSLGTPTYMSPEQAMGERTLDARSDVYALGAVLYEMLTGEPPFTGPTAQAIVAKVMTAEPVPPHQLRKTVPAGIEMATLYALQKLPADRFATAAEFAAALANPTPTLSLQTARASRSHRLLVPMAAGWVLALVALPILVWRWRHPPAPALTATWQVVTLPKMQRRVARSRSPLLALSPDGSIVAYQEDSPAARLVLKRRSALSAIVLPGTERALMPVFSPDGQWIAFVADGQLRKIRVTGGPVSTIGDSAATEPGGPAWLDDGTIIYVSSTTQSLRRVSDAGGRAEVVLPHTPNPGAGMRFPQPLPGGRGILFQACARRCSSLAIYALDLRTHRVNRLLENVEQAWYLPGGRLLYVRPDGVAMIVPFDLAHLTIGGAAVPAFDGVFVSPGFAELTVSPSGTIVYVRDPGAHPDLELVRVNRDGAAYPADTAWHGPAYSFALSPTGGRLAIWSGQDAVDGGMWIAPLDGAPPTRVSFGGSDKRPTWSGDGRSVFWLRDSANATSVMSRPADGSSPEHVVAGSDLLLQELELSRDGEWLVVRTDNGTPGAGDILARRLTSDTAMRRVVATAATEAHPALSPDGRWLAYTSNTSGRNEVYVQPFPEASGGPWQISSRGGTSPVWSPNGRELYFLDADTRLEAAQIATKPTFSALSVRPLFDASAFSVDPWHQGYAALADGAFLFTRERRAAGGAAPDVVWVDNWFAKLAPKAAP